MQSAHYCTRHRGSGNDWKCLLRRTEGLSTQHGAERLAWFILSHLICPQDAHKAKHVFMYQWHRKTPRTYTKMLIVTRGARNTIFLFAFLLFLRFSTNITYRGISQCFMLKYTKIQWKLRYYSQESPTWAISFGGKSQLKLSSLRGAGMSFSFY